MTQSSDGAVNAALAVAREHGFRCDEPVVLRDAWHILLHLKPLPIVARVSSGLPFPQGPNPDDLVRELAVAGHAARAGAAVVPPADEVEAVPYVHGGHIVTVWRYVEPHDEPDDAEAGRALRVIHEALADYDGDLPDTGHPEDTHAMLDALAPSADVEFLRDILRRNPSPGGQALHGDAHLQNCLGSPGGPLWHDFETACRGPREYDLAALVTHVMVSGDVERPRRALAAYGRHDADLLDAMAPLYVVWVTASMLLALPRRPELAEPVGAGLRWLRQR
jgi:Ser/Thr protein kinase RdoA (MazF antagonist)